MVVGASNGIGAAVSSALAREGAHVALAARRHNELLEVQAGFAAGTRSLISLTDVTDREQEHTVFATIHRARVVASRPPARFVSGVPAHDMPDLDKIAAAL